MVIWICVTKDKYEHPIHIADSVEELADKCGVTVNTIRSAISHAKKDGRWCKYVKVEVED